MKKQKTTNTAKKAAAVLLHREALQNLLRQEQRPLKLDQLLRLLHLPRHFRRELRDMLDSLRAEGNAVRSSGGGWTHAVRCRSITGRYCLTRSGSAFVTPENTAFRSIGDIFVPAFLSGGALHGDRVRVAVTPGRHGRHTEGQVIEILERGVLELPVRVVQADGNICRCHPVDLRFPFQVHAALDGLSLRPVAGEFFLVRLLRQESAECWEGELLRRYGAENDVQIQEELVKLNHQVPRDFPPEALAEAAALRPLVPAAAGSPAQTPQHSSSCIPPCPAVKAEKCPAGRGGISPSGAHLHRDNASDGAALYAAATAESRPAAFARREDLRALPLVTIDGEDARDFDDAVCVERQGNGWRLWVAIADVTSYLRPRSALDKEALARSNSWYFPRSVEPMLPERLCNDLCSLRQEEDRPALVIELHLDNRGQVQKNRFHQAFIRSAGRLTYTQVQRALQGDAQARQSLLDLPRGALVWPMLEVAAELAALLLQNRDTRGCLDFSLPEPAYRFAADGQLLAITRRERLFTHQLIEVFMIAANEAVARFLDAQDLPFLYRVHPAPEQDRLDALFRSLTALCPDLLPPAPNARTLASILRNTAASNIAFPVARLILRTQAQARYQPENEGHFGLALTHYCHATSPIRRYADVLVHRALKRKLGMDSAEIPAGKRLYIIADQLNRRERAAMETEREMARRLAVLALRGREGSMFTGCISGVSDAGVFVELDGMPIEGHIPMRALGKDYFFLDTTRQELTGERSGLRWCLGQRLKLRLRLVDPVRLDILLEPVTPHIPPRQKSSPTQYTQKRLRWRRAFAPGS